ncbi:sigma-70 family RNA polymerase sigma factor [Novipirellula maiorica]|nr:sigma-70 family RNA polymerase sigma factor [Rhodopirellula maiorica]
MNNSNERSETGDDDVREVFVTLLMEHRHRIYAFISKQLVNPADVEDVFQKTSVVLWKKMEQFDHDGSFFHWACGIAFHEVLNFLKAQRRSKLHFDSELMHLLAQEAAEEEELTQSRLTALRHCMSLLSERQQQILRRCYMGTDSITEVAEGLGRQRTALYKQLARLKQKLLGCIQKRVSVIGGES